MSRQFTLLLKRTSVAHHRLYDCRHTAASLLLAQGVTPRVVMENAWSLLVLLDDGHLRPCVRERAPRRCGGDRSCARPTGASVSGTGLRCLILPVRAAKASGREGSVTSG